MIHGVVVIEGSPAGMLREFRQLVKVGLFELINNWHTQIMPHHFEPAAKERYKYDPRTVNYLRYKKKRYPMAGPLEFSGESKRQLMRMVRVSGSSKRASGTMNAPPYFWMRPAGHPNKGRELVQTTVDEVMAMAKRLNEMVTGQLNLVKDRKIYR